MKRQKLLSLLLTLSLVTSAYGQETCAKEDPCTEPSTQTECVNETENLAYCDSTASTRWAAYVPVVILVGAAVFLSQAGSSGEHRSGYYSHSGEGSYNYYYPYFGSSYSGSYSSNSGSYSSRSYSSSCRSLYKPRPYTSAHGHL